MLEMDVSCGRAKRPRRGRPPYDGSAGADRERQWCSMRLSAPRFVSDLKALEALSSLVKTIACPHCRQVGALVGHGWLRGYAEHGGAQVVRGRRLLCSARFRRAGCGRTVSVWLETTLPRFTVRTATLSALLEAVVSGESKKAAWERLEAGLSLRSVYRLWARLLAAQSHMRTALCALTEPPPSTDPRPIAQLLGHLQQAFGGAGCVLAGFQYRIQRAVFE